MRQGTLDILASHGLGSAEAIVRASNEELRSLPGIGKKAIQELRQEYGPPLVNWPVEEQCRFLGIPYEKLKAKWDSNGFHKFKWYSDHTNTWVYPEDYVLHRYIAEGWRGVNSEGRFIHTIVKLLTEHELSGYWSLDYFYLTEFATSSPDNLKHHQARLDRCIATFETSTEQDLIERFEYCKHPQPERDEYGRLAPRFHHAINWPTELIRDAYRWLGKDVLREILNGLVAGGEKRRYGWPDLTLIKDGRIRFVEVKTTDRLGRAQIDLWDSILKPLALDVTVTQVKPRLLVDAG